MSACSDVEALIGDQLSGVLAAGDEAALHGHLASCAGCRERLAALLRTQRALDELGATAGMHARLARLRAALAPAAVGRPAWRRHRVAFAIAAVVVLAVGAATWLRQPWRAAPVAVGSVLAAGAGTCEREGRSIALVAGLACLPGDRLSVPAGAAAARCALWAGSSVELAPGTTLAILPGEQPALDLVVGAIVVDSGALAAGGRHLHVRTPAGGVDTEGTRFRLRVADGAATVAVESGAVRVATNAGQARVAAWQRLSFAADRVPAAPVASVLAQPMARLAASGRVVHLAIAPDDATLATGNARGEVELWDVASGRRRDARRMALPSPDAVKSVAFSGDGRHLAAETLAGSVELWDLVSGHSRRVPLRTPMPTCVAFAPGGATLAIGHGSGRITLVDDVQRSTPAERITLTGHTGMVQALAFAPDGRRLLSGGIDASVRAWDASGRALLAVTGLPAPVGAVAVAASGERSAAGFGPRLDAVWSLTAPAPAPLPALPVVGTVFTGETRVDLVGPEHGLYALAFTPDGRLLVSGSGDGLVTVWDAGSGARLLALPAHDAPVRAVAVAADGRLIASGGNDATARLWRLGAE